MENVQYSRFYKKPHFILALILLVFFLKGVFLSVLFPMFKGQDESRHYNTIQYLATPAKKDLNIKSYPAGERDKEKLETYRFFPEIKKAIINMDLNTARGEYFEKFTFAQGFNGTNEEAVNSQRREAYKESYPPEVTGGEGINLYHMLALQIEKLFSGESILFRFYLIRMFSVLLVTASLLFCYFLAKNLNFSPKNSLLITAIIAFQPKFSVYSMNINYASLLILLFFAFTLGGVLFLKQGVNWKSLSLTIIPVMLGMLTKGTGIVLLGMFVILISYYFWKKIITRKNKAVYILVFLLVLILLLSFLFAKYNVLSIISFKNVHSLSELVSSLGNYLSEFNSPTSISKNYWGDLNWTRENIDNYLIYAIWIVETFSVLGFAIYFFSRNKNEFAPKNKYVVFLLAIIFILQISIRFYDWKIFDRKGDLSLGTAGRYFLPNLASHVILMFVGIGALLRKEKYLEMALTGFLILMFSFSIYQIFDVILPRFYL